MPERRIYTEFSPAAMEYLAADLKSYNVKMGEQPWPTSRMPDVCSGKFENHGCIIEWNYDKVRQRLVISLDAPWLFKAAAWNVIETAIKTAGEHA